MGLFDKMRDRLGAKPARKTVPPKGPAAQAPLNGWDTITEALNRLYPDQPNPLHVGTVIKYRLGGADPIDGISIYRATATAAAGPPRPHWHYVTYGFSDLYNRARPAGGGESGFGFELTFRLAADDALTAAQPPLWPASLIQNLARYVFASGNGFDVGSHVDAAGPIELDSDTALTAIGFAADPDLPPLECASGRIQFLAVLGLTDQDLAAAKRWRPAKLYDLLMDRYPKGVTDMARNSLDSEPELADQILAGIAADGSELGALFVARLGLQRVPGGARLAITSRVAAELAQMLPGRLPFGEPLAVTSPDADVEFLPGGRIGVEVESPTLARITLPSELIGQFAAAVPARPGVVTTGPITWAVS